MRRRHFIALLVFVACGGSPPVFNLPANFRRLEKPSTAPDTAARPGDWIFDEKIVVQDAGSSTGWGSYGGSIVDVGGTEKQDPLTEIFFQCELRALAPTRAFAEGRGNDGVALTMDAVERGIPFLDAIVPTQPIGINPSVSYFYKDGVLDVSLLIHDAINSTRDIGCGAVFIKSDAVRGYQGDDWIGTMGPTIKPAFVLFHGGGLSVIAPQADVSVVNAAEKSRLRGGGAVEDVWRLSIGDDLEEALARVRAPAQRRSIVIAPQIPAVLAPRADEVFYEIYDRATSTPVTATRRAAALEPGSYSIRALFDDRQVGAVDLTIDSASGDPLEVALPISGLGAVHVRVSADGQPTPSRLRIGDVIETYVPAEATVIVPSGTFDVEASHGPFFEIARESVTVADGATAEVSLDVPRAFETPGWIASDFHIHGTRSVDAGASRELRVLGGVAEGLDVMVATDHDTVTDYSATALSLGLNGRIRTVPGIEMSMLYGHMNGFPVPVQSPESYFKPSWVSYDSLGVFQRVLEPVEVSQALHDLGAQIVQVNHPRSDQGVFVYIGLDPATASSERTWPECDAFEILNGKRLDDFEVVFADMIGLLKNGRRVVATGVSDVHSDLGVGFARTLIRSSDLDSPWAALKAGRAVATTGPFLTITATAADVAAAVEIGDTITTSSPVSVRIEVRAPSWMSVQRVTLYESGVPVYAREISGNFVGSYVSSASSAFYIAVVRGGRSGPAGKESIAVTNPIFRSP